MSPNEVLFHSTVVHNPIRKMIFSRVCAFWEKKKTYFVSTVKILFSLQCLCLNVYIILKHFDLRSMTVDFEVFQDLFSFYFLIVIKKRG